MNTENLTEQQISEYVISIIGKDIIFPTGFLVLIKLYIPPEITSSGFFNTDKDINRARCEGQIGLVLRLGKDAFTNEVLFPSGAVVKIGDWAMFRGYERTRARVNGHDMLLITDDRFCSVTTSPDDVITNFDPHNEITGS